MSIDGASRSCASLPLGSYPSHARRSFSTPWPLIGAKNFSIYAFHQTLGLPYKPAFCMPSHDLPDLHASILHLSIYPGVCLSNRVPLHNGFFSGKKCKPCVQKLTRGDSYQEEEFLDLESDILEFMDNSERPELFPSRSELMKAGRSDLVEAILAKGGWMVAGWDMEPSTEEQVQKLGDSGIAKATGEANVRVSHESIGVQNRLGYLDVAESAADSKISREIHGPIAASNQASQSAHAVLALERRRGWEKVAGLFGLSSVAKPERGEKPLVLATHEIPKKCPNINGTSQSAAHVQSVDVFGGRRDNGHHLLAGGSQCSEITPGAVEEKKRRRQKSPRNGRAGLPANETVDSTSRRDYWFTKRKTPHMKSDEQQQDEKNRSLSHRIRDLEAELISTLEILKSGRLALNDDSKLKQRHSIDPIELEEASDALEFCETEIMNKKRELRTARAQRTAFEGKLALELMEFKKIMEEKDKRLEHAMQVVKMLRTARIVWPNPASEVFLVGSYDGWTSWRRMEKSSAGVFVTALQLYPGQYEIKFVVNGEWRVDPNRPIIWANGFENNVLTIL